MPKKAQYDETCPICRTKTKVEERAWYYTCQGCGSGINLIGIWWKDQNEKNWNELSQDDKLKATDNFFEKRKEWKDEVFEI